MPQPPERCLSRQAGIVRCCLKSGKSPPRDQTTASPKRLVKSRNIRICAVSLIMIIIPLLPHHLKSVKNHCQIVQIFEMVFGQIVTCQAMALAVFPIILPPWVSDRLPFWGIRNFCIKKAVHWYCTNKPPLRNWRAYFDNPLLFWYNLLLIVASKLWGRWTLEFSGNNFAAYFYWQLHICYRFSYTKSSWISLKK